MAEIVPVDQFLDWYPGWTPELTDSPWVSERSRPLPEGRREPLLVRRLPLASRLLADRLPVRHRLCVMGHADRRALPAPPAGEGLGAAHGRPLPVRGRGHHDLRVGDRLSSAAHREEHASVPAELRRDLGGAQVGARARARLLRELRLRRASPWPRSVSTWSMRVPSTSARGRSTSRSCTRLLGIYLQLYGLCASNGIDPGQHGEDAPGP